MSKGESAGSPRFVRSLGFSVAFLVLVFSVGLAGGQAVGAASQSQLTVTSQDLSGAPISGYYTVLYQGASTISTSFTPAVFTLSDGQTYAVQVDSYGSCNFDHWLDTGSTVPSRSISISANTQLTAVFSCGGHGGTTSVSVGSTDAKGNTLSGFYVALYEGGSVVATGFTPTSFSTTTGASYALLADSYGNCTFSNWSDGRRGDPRPFAASGSAMSFTAIYSCGGGTTESGAGPGTITIYDHRVAASYWAPCFATTCTNPTASCDKSCTGPGAAMWVVLYDSSGNVVATGFSNENGLTFSGLSQTATYLLYPADCDQCHGSTHDVLFAHWGNVGTTVRPLALKANGTYVDAWYTCTNGCSGV